MRTEQACRILYRTRTIGDDLSAEKVTTHEWISGCASELYSVRRVRRRTKFRNSLKTADAAQRRSGDATRLAHMSVLRERGHSNATYRDERATYQSWVLKRHPFAGDGLAPRPPVVCCMSEDRTSSTGPTSLFTQMHCLIRYTLYASLSLLTKSNLYFQSRLIGGPAVRTSIVIVKPKSLSTRVELFRIQAHRRRVHASTCLSYRFCSLLIIDYPDWQSEVILHIQISPYTCHPLAPLKVQLP